MLPEQFKKRMKEYLGDEYEEFISCFDNDRRNHALRINTLKCRISDIRSSFPFLEKEVPWENTGYYYEEDIRISPGKYPYHEAGLYYIQEPSAMAPVHFLDPKPQDKVLDLCAAPGGKSTQIADRLHGEGILVTNEINRERAKILSLNIERMGIKNALVLNETPEHLSEIFEGYFDKILVDAPCSGEGMFRKNDNAADEWSIDNVTQCAKRQSKILKSAANMLLPGGRLVYSTCTFSAEENEESILKFLFKHRDFHVLPAEKVGGMENGRTDLISQKLCDELSAEDGACFDDCIRQVEGAVRLLPHKVNGEGHFLCVLERDGELVRSDGYIPGGRNIPAKQGDIKLFEEFIREDLIYEKESFYINKGNIKCELKCGQNLTGIIINFGEQLYLLSNEMPSTDGLKVIRAGLHLGTVKKGRFEPSHALALFLKKEAVTYSTDFSSDSEEIKSYLNGQTLRLNDGALKGWTLVTTDGYSIGWAKATGGMLKNHYPKGLRINY